MLAIQRGRRGAKVGGGAEEEEEDEEEERGEGEGGRKRNQRSRHFYTGKEGKLVRTNSHWASPFCQKLGLACARP